ncbi:MAG: hypothetical protein L3J26_08445 [Candidatus Polarisedimenticolaceae bacterium]|nr:hypothetical protein [Candidatus Polarisedimenticolaceae bacterium]
MVKQLLVSIALGLLLSTAAHSAGNSSKGSAIYNVLRQQGLLESYMLDAVTELTGTLIRAAQHWPGYGVNRPYVPGNVNIYMIDAARLPEKNILAAFDINLAKHSLQGNAMADEETGILFVDTGLFKSLITVAILFSEQDISTSIGVAAVKARGVDAFRQLWDPAINPALDNAEDTDKWVMLASGAAAFVLAHEMGHIYLGADNATKRRRPMRFKSKQDKDMHWACDSLVDKKYQRQQQIEQKADDFAASILSQVLFPEGLLTIQRLRYELGAHWYIIYSMGEQTVEALYATESQSILNALRMMFGPEIYQELRAKKEGSGRGSVQIFFPKSHPANIRRASRSLGRLAQSPYSFYYNEPPSTDSDIAMFELLLTQECKNLRTRYRK